MVLKKEKEQMCDFLAGNIEEYGIYQILEKSNNHLLVKEDSCGAEHPKTTHILLDNYRRPIADAKRTLLENRRKRIFTSHIFYKDGENFMVRLGARGAFKKDSRSLKRYTDEQINKMVHLRGLEKSVLENGLAALDYYQPKTERLDEGIRIFRMVPVIFDYSHIVPGDPGYGFARNSVSADYRIAEEQIQKDGDAIGLAFDERRYLSMMSLIRTKEKK